MIEYLSGAVTVGFIVASALFMRLWRRRRDRLLLALAIAFTSTSPSTNTWPRV